MKKVLIAGTASGTGKTTITLAIEAALCRRGLVVQPFKCGPDYLDTAHHSAICRRKCRNLDTIMLSVDENSASLQRASRDADIVVAEGMMGLFDGISGESNRGSSADIARALRIPIVLVMDASCSSRSIAATLRGFATFDPEVKISAVILNRVASEGHFQMLEDAIRGTTEIPILGWIPKNSAWAIPERHLGLVDANERAWTEDQLASFGDIAESHLDLDRFVDIASEVGAADKALSPSNDIRVPAKPIVKIGVARDEAFSFYYEDNFDLLRDYGAELVEFSPLHDKHLPEGINGLYIGGGYPELHAKVLSANHEMLAAMRQFCGSGGPVYAECGGMMYLADAIIVEDALHPMTGVLPLTVEMSPSLVKFGYAKIRIEADCVLGPKHTEAIGHSFHYSKIEATGDLNSCYELEYLRAGRFEREGYAIGNVLASYIHLHFRSNHELPQNFIRAALLSRAETSSPGGDSVPLID
jgi:cobyrinic acid a,c-diamide synthase